MAFYSLLAVQAADSCCILKVMSLHVMLKTVCLYH